VVPALAEEAGQWRGKGVLFVVEKTSTKAEDRANHTVTATEYAPGKPKGTTRRTVSSELS
jgi:hypothetical protein